jgi:tetratricopeptide (TPR) repeat protein
MGPIVDLYVSLDDLDSLLTYRKHMAEVLAPDSFRLLVTDYFINMMQSGWQAALMLDSLPEAWAGHPAIAGGRALAYLIGRRYQAAYENFLQAEPAWTDPEQWPLLIEENSGGCYAAGIFISAGELESGRELLRQSLHYLEVELPKYVEHTDRYWNLGVCYLLDGRYDEALRFFEQYVDHGHWGDWHWFYVKDMPYWDPVRENPRYIALMSRVEELKAEQRELIRRLDEPTDAGG